MVALQVLLRHPHCLLPLSSSSYISSTTPAPPTTSSSSSFFQPRRIRCPCLRSGGHSASGSSAESARPGGFSFRDAGGGRRGGGAGAWEEAEEGAGRGHRGRGKRRWWSDDDPYDGEWDDDKLEQPWERIWILKVFKSYGYLLPAVIASMLLATGPKAFLMALALPLGQSALSLAIDKLWGNSSKVARAKYKPKKKPFARAASDFRRAEEEEISRGYKGREVYQSWMSSHAVASEREYKSPVFGGWDELDRRREYAEGPARQQSSKTTSTSFSRAQPIKKGKLARRERNKEMPLFLRLLIAIFPFLGCWTRML